MKYKRVSKGALGTQACKISNGRCTTKEIASQIEKEIGIPAIRTMSVLNAFSEIASGLLLEGKSVHVEGLGIMSLSIGLENGKPAARRMSIIPAGELKKRFADIHFEEVAND